MCDSTLFNEDEGDVVLVLIFLVVLQGEDGGGGGGGGGEPNYLRGEAGPGGGQIELSNGENGLILIGFAGSLQKSSV